MEVVHFTDLSGDVQLRIYTVAGRHVITLKNERSFEVEWNLTNERGERVGAGIYIWVATNSDGVRKVGHLAIIR